MAQTANFFTPGYGDQVQQQDIERQRKMAEMLRGQSQAPTQGQMVDNHYVAPSITQHLAKLLAGYAAGKTDEAANAKQQSLIDAMQTRTQTDLGKFNEAMRESPEVPATPTQPEVQGNNPSAYMPEQAGQAAIPAKQANPNAAMAALLNSQNTGLQGAGGDMLKSQLQSAMLKQRIADIMKGGALGQTGQAGQTAQSGQPDAGAPMQNGTQPGGPASFFGMDPRAAAFMASGDPAMEKIGASIQEANKPMPLREGDLVVPDGRGGFRSAYQQPKLEAGMVATRTPSGSVTGAAALPGYAQGMAGIHGATTAAQEGAKAQNETVTVNTPQGPRLMTRAQATQMAGGGESPLPQAQPGMNGSFSGPAEDVIKSINQIADPQERSNAMSAYANQMTGNQQRGPGIPLQTESSKSYQTAQGKAASDYSSALNDRVRQGSDLNMRLQESVKALQNFQTGGGKETRSQLAQAAQAIGAPDGVVNGIAGGDLGSMQEFKKLAVQQAMEQLKVAMGGAGRIAQAEFKVFQANNPNLDTDPSAVKKIFDFNTRIFNRDMTEQKEFQQFQKQGNDPSDFPAYWSQRQTALGYTNPALNAQRDASPAAKSSVKSFDAEKERRYQEWKAQQK